METAASVFSWVGGILRTIALWIWFFVVDINISAWLVLIPLFYTVLSAIILIRRQSEVAEGRKIPFGINTLIWCSIVGGILTLCIPEDDLNGYEGYLASKMYDEAGEKNELSEDEKIELITKYKKLLDEGTITQEDFEAKKKDLLQ